MTLTVQAASIQAATFAVLKEAFEAANPGISVKIQTISDDQKQTTNLQVVTGSNPPDVAFVPTNSNVYTSALEVDGLLPLTDVWENQKLDSRYDASTAAATKAADGIPYVVTTDNLLYNVAFYNKDLFEQADITVPENRRIPDNETLYEIADKLKAIGVAPVNFSGKDIFAAGWLIDGLLPTAATPSEMENYLTSYNPGIEVTVEYTDQPFVQTIEQLAEWAEHGVFQDGFLGQDLATALAQFQQGQAGIFIGASAHVASLTESGLSYDWLLLPPVEGSTTTVTLPSYQGDSWAVPAKADHPDEAKLFLEFMMSDEMQVEAFGGNDILPIVNTVSLDQLTELDPVTRSLVEDTVANGAPIGWTSAVPGAFGQTHIGGQVQALWSGQASVSSVAEAQQAELLKVREG
ncbi:MAG: extracellular solute-binding protein [Microbacteriaceae bacterium]|nr:extracellular solute-binding protein [Microbacteriaceae bacterium]